MTISLVAVAAFVAAFSVAPYLLLTTRGKREYLLADVTTYLAGAAILVVAPFIQISIVPSVGFVVLAYAKLLAVLFVALRAARDEAVIDSPFRVSLFALAVQFALFQPASSWVLNGDERQYLLVTESIVRDFDVDLANQYRESEKTSVALPGVRRHVGDPVGARGEQYSRLEPFFSLLLLPGFLLAKKAGAIATMFFFGFLLVRSTWKLLQEEGFDYRSRLLVIFFLAFGSPALFYSMRLWPEVPGAFFFVEALRALRGAAISNRRWMRLLFSIVALSLLKLRFVLIAVPLLLWAFRRFRPSGRALLLAGTALLVPFAIAFAIAGNPLLAHGADELLLRSPAAFARGLFGTLIDAQAGLLFVTPLFLVAMVLLPVGDRVPESIKAGALAAAPYLVLLFPRPEWHGGWSPPLRYVMVFMPLLAVVAAYIVPRMHPALIAVCGFVTIARAVHGAAFPWSLFHIANGETAAGEYLSRIHRSDFSRLFPSLIRTNDAAVAASLLLVVTIVSVFLLRRTLRRSLVGASVPLLLSLFLAAFVLTGRQPGRVVEFEDTHVEHDGGALYPEQFRVARFMYVAGWTLSAGDSAAFNARPGRSYLHYQSNAPARISIGRAVYELASSSAMTSVAIEVPRTTGPVVLRCLSGEVTVDRIEHD